MGLDGVELIMEIEDAFDISFPDDRASRMYTVGDVFDYIVEVKGNKISPRDVCLSATTFYRIRRAICKQLGLSRAAIRPRITLESTLPVDRRPEDWGALQSAISLKLPRLVRPGWIVAIATILSIAVAAGACFLAVGALGPGGAVFVFMAALIAAAYIAAEMTSSFQTEFCASFATYRGLSHVVLAHNYAAICKQFNSWNPTDAWEALKLIVVEQLGVRPEVVTKDASFVRDLGMG